MSSEVPPLAETDIIRMMPSQRVTTYGDQLGFARDIEQAICAQWAAEVERLKTILTPLLQEHRDLVAERDSAQAEAKLMREALIRACLGDKEVANSYIAALQPGDSHG